MLDFLISNAYAQDGGGGEAAIGNVIFMVLLFGIFYFLLIRPQQKQAKQHKEMINHLQRGDKVVTGGGIIGKVHRVEDDIVVVEVGEVETAEKTFRPMRMRVRRSTMGAVLMKAGVSSGDDTANKTDDAKETSK